MGTNAHRFVHIPNLDVHKPNSAHFQSGFGLGGGSNGGFDNPRMSIRRVEADMGCNMTRAWEGFGKGLWPIAISTTLVSLLYDLYEMFLAVVNKNIPSFSKISSVFDKKEEYIIHSTNLILKNIFNYHHLNMT